MPSVTAVLDRFLHHAEIVTCNGESYRLRGKAAAAETAAEANDSESIAATPPIGSNMAKRAKRSEPKNDESAPRDYRSYRL